MAAWTTAAWICLALCLLVFFIALHCSKGNTLRWPLCRSCTFARVISWFVQRKSLSASFSFILWLTSEYTEAAGRREEWHSFQTHTCSDSCKVCYSWRVTPSLTSDAISLILLAAWNSSLLFPNTSICLLAETLHDINNLWTWGLLWANCKSPRPCLFFILFPHINVSFIPFSVALVQDTCASIFSCHIIGKTFK